MPIDISSTLRRAIVDLENQRSTIDRQIATLRSVLGVGAVRNTRRVGLRRRRTPMSAAQRAAVGKRMKAYWAKRREAASKKGSKKK